MATIDRVIQLQQQGMSDSDIGKALTNEGISTKEVTDSLAQAKIKMAVSEPSEGYQESYPQAQQQYAQPAPDQPQQQADQQYYAQTPQAYPDQQQYAYQEQSSMNVETITEIVDRITSEKLRELATRIKQAMEFKAKTEEDLIDIKDRLKRIEMTMDSLQRGVITKIGEFGQSNALVHKDLENLHTTVSKLMNPLVDNINEMRKVNSVKK